MIWKDWLGGGIVEISKVFGIMRYLRCLMFVKKCKSDISGQIFDCWGCTFQFFFKSTENMNFSLYRNRFVGRANLLKARFEKKAFLSLHLKINSFNIHNLIRTKPVLWSWLLSLSHDHWTMDHYVLFFRIYIFSKTNILMFYSSKKLLSCIYDIRVIDFSQWR